MYIDGVFSGGGVKGFALIGAYQAIEERGLKFKRIAGTSAGSIIACLIMAGYSSKELLKIMEEIDAIQFLDPRKLLFKNPVSKWILLYFYMGLYKGEALEQWLSVKLAEKGVVTFADLPKESLRVVASDLSRGRILTLPDDLPVYNYDARTFPVAKAIRMSCSIPYFFEPVKLKTQNGTAVIVDGGVLSNFPIWLFWGQNNLRRKERPVLGIKLSAKDENAQQNKIYNAIDLFGALFETMKDAHDARYVSRKHEKDIIFIPVEHTLSTEFSLTEEKKLQLTQIGYETAKSFLKSWCY
ncbi:hypothetical protein EJF36_13515 [Bacillus sp. HMF5848]|uniref:patatin-like phospholipase family protein n=1 Tax=Bacillus sp. HMF5848 TaxID=2495421 RepID=UPI000F791F6E|nr:patatin-like phospholipase family protein [Bacillus sp. HMF5848]RSK27813.1 hypothetical protein EJF36_13515 [Bacillus sp. HMF5848]